MRCERPLVQLFEFVASGSGSCSSLTKSGKDPPFSGRTGVQPGNQESSAGSITWKKVLVDAFFSSTCRYACMHMYMCVCMHTHTRINTCIPVHYVALHCIALHCIALHCIALHCISVHYITLH